MLRRIVEFFDFELLRDPIYVNMMLGMAIALFAEINFAVHTPFILEDMGFGNEHIATVMSTIAGVDLVSRGLIPFISEWLNIPARHMALISLLILIASRSSNVFAISSYSPINQNGINYFKLRHFATSAYNLRKLRCGTGNIRGAWFRQRCSFGQHVLGNSELHSHRQIGFGYWYSNGRQRRHSDGFRSISRLVNEKKKQYPQNL